MNRHPDDVQKWAFLESIPERDARHPEIGRIAHALMVAAQGNRERFLKLAMALAGNGIAYVRDTQRTGSEDIAGYTRDPGPDDAVEALRSGRDDCDAKARLFVALCLAQSFRARMRPLWKQGRLQHVSAEVYRRGNWLPVELTLARALLGEEPESVPRETNTGRWRRSQ